MTPHAVMRRAQASYFASFVTFITIAGFGGKLEGRVKFSVHSWWALLLAIPVGLRAVGIYTIVRYWRCEYCGALLPGISAWTPRRQWRCLKCLAPFEL
jgi:hypothetical protein